MIEFKNVSKHFGPTQVLHNIDSVSYTHL
ncbi:hypothetical protein, partial [Escherichia coli]